MSMSRSCFALAPPAQVAIGTYLVGTFSGQPVGIRPSLSDSAEWISCQPQEPLLPLAPEKAVEIQYAWLKSLRMEPKKLSWLEFTSALAIPRGSLNRYVAGDSIPYARAIRLVQLQDRRFPATHRAEGRGDLIHSSTCKPRRQQGGEQFDPAVGSLQYLATAGLTLHPHSRKSPREGAEWEAFVGDIRRRGIVDPLVVRPHDKGFQVLGGSRRLAAALEAGIEEVPVMIRVLNEEKARGVILADNLHRKSLSPVDEGRLVCGMLKQGFSLEQVATLIRKPATWVISRRDLMSLGEEALAAMKLPKEDPKHLGVRVVEEILKAPEELRPRAILLVMHSDFQAGVLNPRQAAEVIQENLVKPYVEKLGRNHRARS